MNLTNSKKVFEAYNKRKYFIERGNCENILHVLEYGNKKILEVIFENNLNKIT